MTCEHAEEKEEDKEEDNCPKWYDDSTGLIPYQLSLILCFYNLWTEIRLTDTRSLGFSTLFDNKRDEVDERGKFRFSLLP